MIRHMDFTADIKKKKRKKVIHKTSPPQLCKKYSITQQQEGHKDWCKV